MQTILSDLDRRTIAQLSIPRNVADLTGELRVDVYSHILDPETGRIRARRDDEVFKHLEELGEAGLVAQVGTGEDGAAALASKAQAHKKAMELPDEKAEIFSRRLDDPRRAWRIEGPTYMVTEEGLEWLHAPVPGAGPPMGPDRLASVIEQEHARVLRDGSADYAGSIHDQGTKDRPWSAGGVLLDKRTGKPFEGDKGPTLADKLLLEEYTDWLGQVLAEYDRLYSDGKLFRKRIQRFVPAAGGAGWTDLYENSIIDVENQKATLTAAAPWFMALSILAFTDADTGTTADDGTHKPTYVGYGRISVAAADMATAASGSSSNANALTAAACTSGSSAVVAFGNCAASTVGLLRKYGTCASTAISTTQTPATFNAGSYTTSAD